ncbi:MAG: hypothetical protein Q7T11_05295, partial [Deltaproteobacteria bacterium]|nr:hypothetical protein [Deltaproteobacteria bacterium]
PPAFIARLSSLGARPLPAYGQPAVPSPHPPRIRSLGKTNWWLYFRDADSSDVLPAGATVCFYRLAPAFFHIFASQKEPSSILYRRSGMAGGRLLAGILRLGRRGPKEGQRGGKAGTGATA